jgi:outer membrane lipoprotein
MNTFRRSAMSARSTAVAVLALALAGCATVSKPLQGEFTAITPHQAIEQDSTGTAVRWGGRIVRTEPLADRTCFEVLSSRLDVTGRPAWAGADDTHGRFIACRVGFYDPALFTDKREVTFTGRLEGYENRRIGEYSYRFPRVAADVVYLWPEENRTRVITTPAPWPWWGWW